MEKPIMKDPVFLGYSSALATVKDLQTARDLLDTLIANREGCVGMAANMIGGAKRIIVFDNDGEYMTMFNPEIVKYSDPYEAEEGACRYPELGKRLDTAISKFAIRTRNSRRG